MKSKYGIRLPDNDFQADKVYDWCNNYILKWDTQFLDMNTCNLISEDVFNGFHNIWYPKVILSHGKKSSKYNYETNTIKLIDSMRYRPILLHEIAHALTRFYYGKNAIAHGAEFVGFFMILLNKWSKIPLSQMKNTADLNDIKYTFKYGFKKGFRARPSLINKIDFEIKLSNRRMPGLTVARKNPKGGYRYVYVPSYWA